MRGKSHLSLGQYLIDRYFPDLPRQHQRAFLFGCIEPDRNPVTYLKGSFRCQWLKGHNFCNAFRFMTRIAIRLEQKKQFTVFDYYTLGKLIHYTADAFTSAHNETFPYGFSAHREYENQLQIYFLSFLQNHPPLDTQPRGTVMDDICCCHREYSCQKADICRDSRYALQACCRVISGLKSRKPCIQRNPLQFPKNSATIYAEKEEKLCFKI